MATARGRRLPYAPALGGETPWVIAGRHAVALEVDRRRPADRLPLELIRP
jgi:hypothetical protein